LAQQAAPAEFYGAARRMHHTERDGMSISRSCVGLASSARTLDCEIHRAKLSECANTWLDVPTTSGEI
jgi:hypothetical protein